MSITRALVLPFAAAIAIPFLACSGGDSKPSGTPRPTLTLAPLPPEPVPTVLVHSPAGSPPTLPSRLEPVTKEIILHDRGVARLADGATISVESVGGWFWGPDPETGDLLVVATVGTVSLGRPVDHERVELPSSARRSDFYHLFPDDAQARYSYYGQHSTTEWHLENISEFEVEVDFNTGEVVDFQFLPYASDEVAEALLVTSEAGSTYVPGQDVDIPADGLERLYEGSAKTREIIDGDPRLGPLVAYADNVSSFGSDRFGYLYAYFDTSVSVTGSYPVILDEDRETLDYRSVLVPLDEPNTRQLAIKVDLEREEIISVEPDEGD